MHIIKSVDKQDNNQKYIQIRLNNLLLVIREVCQMAKKVREEK